MNISLKASAKRTLNQLFRYKAKSSVKSLLAHDSPELKAIGEAINESLNDFVSDEEQLLINSIENRRFALLKSKEEIPVIDFGAGKIDSGLTSQEMMAGVKSHESLAEISELRSKTAFWAKILFKIVRKLQPLSCVELGTCVGISAAYQAGALKLNGKGHLRTIEGSPEISRIAQETLDNLDLKNTEIITGSFHEKLKDTLESAKPIDFFFNDGHHDHDALLKYFEETVPYLARKAVIIFDDISWSKGMEEAWSKIKSDQRVAATVDLKNIGIALIDNNATKKEEFSIPLLD